MGRWSFGCVSLGALLCACTGDFDTSRQTPPRGTLGREMYTLVCDRVGAQALREDVTGSSFHAVCHADEGGNFQDQVDTAKLPSLDPEARDVDGKPVTVEQQQKNRQHRIARVEAVARRRADLIAAFDLAFTGEPVGTKDLDDPDPKKSCDPSPGETSQADLHVELGDTLGRMTELYDDDTIPNLTRGLSKVMDQVERSPEAQAALARFDARRGYRPTNVAMGVARPALSYPRIVDLANALLRLLADHGSAHESLTQLMAVARQELRTAKETPALPPLVVTGDRLSRPRGNLELARNILLQQDPAFSIGEPRFVVARDERGIARVTLTNGKLPAPFVDVIGPGGKPDGLADVDDLGQFVTNGAPAPQPFKDFYGDGPPVQRDASGRAENVFDYIDVSSTYLASLSHDLVPLLEADPSRQHETLMDLLSGFVVVAGAREDGPKSTREYDGGVTVPYRAFRGDDSPVLDLVYAVGQVFADPTTDDTLALLEKLSRDKPDVLARMIGMGLAVKAIADKHPEAAIPEKSTLWDEMLDVAAQIAEKPALVEDVIRAFGDDATPDLAKAAVAYMSFRDHLSYDRNDLNGTPFDVTTGKVENMKTPVDRSKPDTGENRSAFQKFLSALHDTKDMSTCTKEGAVAHIVWNGIAMDFPSFAAQSACFVLGADVPPDPMPLCGMFRIKDISHDLVDAVLGDVQLDIRDDCLKKLVSSPLTGIVGGADAFLEDVSGIKGFNTKPTVQGVNRLVYFDLPYPGHAGDSQNGKTLNFLKDLFDTTPTNVCPPLNFTDTDGAKLNLHQCSTFENTLRDRDSDALFPLEQFGFLEASKPLARAFKNSDANLLFVELFDILHRHWGSPAQSKKECDPSAPKTSTLWCSQDGAVSYEPLLAEALAGDLFPSLHDSVNELAKITIDHCDKRDTTGLCTHTTPWDGVKVMAEAVKAMVDPARNKGLVQRNGDGGVVRNDGTKNAQVTPIYLLIDALKGFDRRMADWKAANPGDDRLPKWRRARSQMVDQLFSVDGTGKASKMHNPAVPKMMPVLASTLRQQIAANCPDPTKGCTWGRKDLPKKTADVVTGPTFAALMDVLDAVVKDDGARGELERLLQFLLQSGDADAQKAMLASMVDVMQIFEDDANMTALLHAVADAAEPELRGAYGEVISRGMILSTVETLARVLGEVRDPDGTRICAKEIDPNRTFAVALRRLVTPPPDGGAPPIEVLIDVAADVNRVDPSTTTKLAPPDYASIAHEVSDFCMNPSRGLEQVYTVIKQATKDL